MVWQGYDNEGCMPGDRERILRTSALRNRVRRIPDPVAVERTRLERAVIEAAKEYGRTARATEDHMKTADKSQASSAEGWRLLRDLESSWEHLLLDAVYALLEFESQQK